MFIKIIKLILSLIAAGIAFSLTESYILFIASLILVFILLMPLGKRKKNTAQELPQLNKEKEQHYENQGMTAQEINFFRDTMSTAKEQIIHLQNNINQSTKLKAIDLRNDTLRATKAMFKELVKEPKKLHLANHFLYTHLPNIVELTDKYIEVSNHEIKSKETYQKLEESVQVIDQVSKLIKNDYEQFVADDLDDLDIEISVAKTSIKMDNRTTEQHND